MTTYGDLIGLAGADVHAGLIGVLKNRFADPEEARNTVGAYYDLLHALRAHTWELVDPRGVREDLLDARVTKNDCIEAVAVRIFKSIGPLCPRRPSTPYPDADFQHPWLSAARRLGAAADLLASHSGPGFTARSELADTVQDPSNRLAALGAVADLTLATLTADVPIGLRAGQAGVDWNLLQRWLPEEPEPKALTDRLRGLAEEVRPRAAELWDIPLNYHPVRVGDPLEELVDRLGRLRHSAWTLRANPDYSVATLRDLAGLGLAVHAHAAVLHGLDLDIASGRTHPILAAAHAWQNLAVDLHDYLAPGPVTPEIRSDVLAARQLLSDLVPLGRPHRLRSVPDPATRRFGAVLNTAMGTMARIAGWNSHEFATLARSGHVRMRASDLSGAYVTDHPDLAKAKIRREPIRVPEARASATLHRYAAVRAAAESRQPVEAAALTLGRFAPAGAHTVLAVRRSEF